ncbi:MAG: gliding motility-associated C-terminal domain-containing protein [Saprospiraceae bacterium]
MRPSHVTILVLLFCRTVFAQTYFATNGFANSGLFEITINGGNCNSQFIGNLLTPAGDTVFTGDLCQCPDGTLYLFGGGGDNVYEIDPLTGQLDLKMSMPGLDAVGAACGGDGLVYAISTQAPGNLYALDPNAGTSNLLGPTGFPFNNDLIFYDSLLYVATTMGLARICPDDPDGGSILFPTNQLYTGLSVYPGSCNTLVGSANGGQLFLINLDDETETPLCSIPILITGLSEFSNAQPMDCQIPFDLDLNNSSGAQGNDYNAAIFNCHINNVRIADVDAHIPNYPVLKEMTISLANGILDPGKEGLWIGSTPGLVATGVGTTTLTLTNMTGNATLAQFLNSLQNVQYKNAALSPTGGMREVAVSFITKSGSQSEEATCFVQVQQLPQVQVDLGGDKAICQGGGTILDAGNPGLSFHWSGGQSTQTITASNQGTYKVTVSDGVNCPGADEVFVLVLPSEVLWAVTYDTAICLGETTPILLTMLSFDAYEFNVYTDGVFTEHLSNIQSGYQYFVSPTQTTTYSFEPIMGPGSTSCLIDSTLQATITVVQAQTVQASQTICEGDSVWLNNDWQSATGIYIDTLTAMNGCDSIISTNLSVQTSDTIFLASQTCDPALAGIFTQNYQNINGCDSTVITIVSLSLSDTILLASQTCDPALAGVFTENYQNINGCDSTVITNILLLPSDTVFLASQTCDPALAGVFTEIYENINGCDSTVVTNISLLPSDTIFLASQTCDPALVGIFTQNLQNIDGCDSTVVTNVSLSLSDTIFLASQTCDPALAGVFIENLQNINGCDSTVITNVSLLPSDTVYLASQTCDPALAGVFAENLQNINGCDSTVITNIALLPSDTVYFASQTCDPALVGIFTENYENINGCDSTVITIVSLSLSDTIFLASQTCDPALAGVFTENYQNINGCDSTVITNMSLLPSDTILLTSQTCDPALAGVSTEYFQNINGCDSTVVTTTLLLLSDTTQLDSFTCELLEVGIFEQYLVNEAGCDSIVLLTVSLLPPPDCEEGGPDVLNVYVPNAFSPNGDGSNDLFQVYTNGMASKINLFRIFDRWGELVFEQYDTLPNDLSNAWDGSFKGKPVDAGTYIYLAELLGKDGKVKRLTGEIVLIR